jgi:hypothetical protein
MSTILCQAPLHNREKKDWKRADRKTCIITLELCKLKKLAEKPAHDMQRHELWAVYFEYIF